MDLALSRILGAVIFGSFVIGLSESINAVPFYIIIAIVVALVVYDSYEDAKEALRGNRRNHNGERPGGGAGD